MAIRQSVIILGAGGHAQVVADILFCARDAGAPYEPIGFVDDDPALATHQLLGLPVLGRIADLTSLTHDAIIVAIGDNTVRARVFARASAAGETLVNAIHPRAVVARDVRIGRNVMICAGVVVNPGTVIYDDVILNTGCSVDHHGSIGAHTHIAPGAHLGGNVRIGALTLVGLGASVLPGVSIGEQAVIGAGAVVTRDVTSNATCVGAPARSVTRRPVEQ